MLIRGEQTERAFNSSSGRIHLGMVAGFVSVPWPASNRNRWPDCVGIRNYFGDVLTEELTGSLSRMRGAFVVPRTTAYSYKTTPKDVREIGEQLRVRYALEGSVQKSGSKLRVVAQLIDATSGAHIWTDQFDTVLSDLLSVQDEIVTRLARALQIELSTIEASRIARTRPDNPDAEDLALQCEAGYLRHGVSTPDARRAFALCGRALDLDPDNARALALFALQLVVRANNLLSDSAAEDMRRGADFAERALKEDANNYVAHYARAFAVAFDHPDEAIDQAQQALTLNPSFLSAYIALYSAYWASGRSEKALEVLDSALKVNPRDPFAYLWLANRGKVLFTMTKYSDASDFYRRSVLINADFSPSLLGLAASDGLIGNKAEATEMLNRYYTQMDATKTISALRRRQGISGDFMKAYYDKLNEGLRMAGMPD